LSCTHAISGPAPCRDGLNHLLSREVTLPSSPDVPKENNQIKQEEDYQEAVESEEANRAGIDHQRPGYDKITDARGVLQPNRIIILTQDGNQKSVSAEEHDRDAPE